MTPLADLGQDVWIDSRQLRGGDLPWPAVRRAINECTAYAVLVSPAALQSAWVGRELQYALDLQQARLAPGLWAWLAERLHLKAWRPTEPLPVIPLSLDRTKLGVLEQFFGGERRALAPHRPHRPH